MNKHDFERIIKSFADEPEDIIIEKGEFLAKINGEQRSFKLIRKEEGLFCEEDGAKVPVNKWVAKELGKLDILARAILEKIPEDAHIIPTPGIMIINQESIPYANAADRLLLQIENGQDFTTNVIYLTSEAGEGKTSIMNSMARKQAQEYLSGNSTWIFVPIALSGRSFLRLDEIIIGTLANYYRFRGYYIESFLELIKMNQIVLGLDGFEEMSIEGAEGDVISSLGNLVNSLDSEGTLVFAARKAYYNYTNLRSQAKLFDSFKDKDVTFYELFLTRWDKYQFISLLESYGFTKQESNDIYLKISNALGSEHPILTRAVLARRLAEEIAYENGTHIKQIIAQFATGESNETFSSFVKFLLRRETRKWVTQGEIAEPLLSLDEHDSILEMIAEEMWISNTEKLKESTILYLMELGCDSFKLLPAAIGQCKEKILHHALITLHPDGLYSFCHQEFFLFYLGKHVAHSIMDCNNTFSLKKLLDKKIVPSIAIQEACRVISASLLLRKVIDNILSFSEVVSRHSCLSQNLSSIILPILRNYSNRAIVKGLFCASSTLMCTEISNVEFSSCVLEKVFFDDKLINNVTFKSCDIAVAEINLDRNKFIEIVLDESLPSHLIVNQSYGEKRYYYDPNTISRKLFEYGINIEIRDNNTSNEVEEDEEIILFFKIVHAFQRSTGLNENVLKTKIGSRWNTFEEKILNPVIEKKIFEEIEYKGNGKQRRFRLNCSFTKLEDAREKCDGNFGHLLEILGEQRV